MSEASENPGQLTPVKRALLAVETMRTRLEEREARDRAPLAIVGLACRFPGAADAEAFWQLLRRGGDAITQVPASRWDMEEYYDPDPETPGKIYCRWGGFLEDVDLFDADFFGIAPREAESMDPQQRLLLEVAWEALEDAGQAPGQLAGQPVGVFLGLCNSDYGTLRLKSGEVCGIDAYSGSGSAFSMAAGRISYTLGLQGPSMVIDTACSSSLVALHLAGRSLRLGECDLALIGGVNLILSPEATINFCKARMLSPEGRCKTFDAAADGYVRGEGCGIVVLKRLAEAQRDGDRILAVVRGTAVNQDGHSSGLTAPNGSAQERVIRQALAAAGLEPGQIQYVEAHGTATALGDPIEVRALTRALLAGRPADQPLMIGSVKTNIGHLEAAAGVAGLIKVVLSLMHGQLPPHLHLRRPSSHLPQQQPAILIPTRLTPWPGTLGARRAGVSSFGFSGTNVHVVLEQAPSLDRQTNGLERPLHLLGLSARNPAALQRLAADYERYLAARPDADLASLCYTALSGRDHFACRAAFVGGAVEQVREGLQAFGQGVSRVGVFTGQTDQTRPPKVGLLFTGQGIHYAGMGQELYATQPVFRQTLEQCAHLLDGLLDRPLLSLFYPPTGEDGALQRMRYSQPALFSLSYALAQLWLSWGVRPAALLGHGLGEYVAACVAGVFSLEEGLRLAAGGARLIEATSADGAMAVLATCESAVVEALRGNGEVSIAAVDGPSRVVVSGASPAVERLCAQFAGRGIDWCPLPAPRALHSPLIEPALDAFERLAAGISYQPPRFRMIAGLTGQAAAAETLTDPTYWRRQLREPVRFAAGMQSLAALGCEVYLEIGAHPVLLDFARSCIADRQVRWLPSLCRGRPDWEPMLESLAALYVHGAPLDWPAFDRGYGRLKAAAPRYPFQRRRYWFGAAEAGAEKAAKIQVVDEHPLLGRVQHSSFRELVWEALLAADAPAFLRDHQVYQMPVLPAAGFVEMALAGAGKVLEERSLEIENLELSQALVLPPATKRRVRTRLQPGAAGAVTFQVESLDAEEAEEDAEWILHAGGTVRAAGIGQSAMELSAFQEQCSESLPVDAYYAELAAIGLAYGPDFRWLEQVRRGEGKALGKICLPAAQVGAMDHYRVHPALLDCCLQVVGALYDQRPARVGDEAYLPVGIERLWYSGASVAGGLWSGATLRSSATSPRGMVADLALFEPGGRLVGEVEGLTFVPASRAALGRVARGALEDWFYRLEWREQEAAEKAAQPGGVWLVLGDEGGIAESVVEALQARGQTCCRVVPGARFAQQRPGWFTADPASVGDFEQLLARLGRQQPCWGVVQLWGVDGASAVEGESSWRLTCGSTLHLLQALVRTGQTPRVWLATRGAQPVGPHPVPLAVDQASRWGMGRVLASEHPEFRPVMVDLEGSATAAENAAQLLAELTADSEEPQVVWRGGRRYVARLALAQRQNPAFEPLRFREDASYLITGGLGGLGMAVAGWMLEQGARQLLLVGRGAASAEVAHRLTELRAKGRVEVLQADISVAAEVERVLEAIESDLSPLRGIVHAAGVVDDGLLIDLTMSRFEQVMAPKVKGAWNLHRLTRDLPLEHFVLFSSMASLLGTPAQASYAAANAVLDALAHQRHAEGLPALSLNWGPWAGVGMAARVDAGQQRRWASQGMGRIRVDQGLEALGVWMGEGQPQVGVLPIQWSKFLDQFVPGSEPPVLSEIAARSDLKRRSKVQQGEFFQRLQEADDVARLTLLTDHVRILAAGILGGAQAAELEVRRPLIELGMDSLMALEFTRALGNSLGLRLLPTLLFDHPTIEALAGYLQTALKEHGQPVSQTVEERLLSLVEEVSGLPPEAAQARLAAAREPLSAPARQALTALSAAQRELLLQRLLEQGESADLLRRALEATARQPVDLGREIVLEADIRPSAEVEAPVGPVPPEWDLPKGGLSAILLTGATGFLGSYLLAELLENTRATIYCLVRARNAEEGAARVVGQLAAIGRRQDAAKGRIVPVVGNLLEPRLGIAAEVYESLAAGVEAIFHSAAIVNFVQPYPVLKAANVSATRQLLRLACQTRTKLFHHVSTLSVFMAPSYLARGVIGEDDPLDEWRGLSVGYIQSKWVAEQLTMEARRRGLPVCIYRPPLITGDTRSGYCKFDDLMPRLIKGCVELGIAPELTESMSDFAPVDFVARAIVHLAGRQDSPGKAFHLLHPEPISWKEAIEALDERGYGLRKMVYADWVAALRQTGPDNSLSPLLPFFERVPEGILRLPEFDCRQTGDTLSAAGIQCPPAGQLFDTYLAYFVRSGFLAPPPE